MGLHWLLLPSLALGVVGFAERGECHPTQKSIVDIHGAEIDWLRNAEKLVNVTRGIVEVNPFCDFGFINSSVNIFVRDYGSNHNEGVSSIFPSAIENGLGNFQGSGYLPVFAKIRGKGAVKSCLQAFEFGITSILIVDKFIVEGGLYVNSGSFARIFDFPLYGNTIVTISGHLDASGGHISSILSDDSGSKAQIRYEQPNTNTSKDNAEPGADAKLSSPPSHDRLLVEIHSLESARVAIFYILFFLGFVVGSCIGRYGLKLLHDSAEIDFDRFILPVAIWISGLLP